MKSNPGFSAGLLSPFQCQDPLPACFPNGAVEGARRGVSTVSPSGGETKATLLFPQGKEGILTFI